MAELADAQVSGACGVTPVWVQVPPLARRQRDALRATGPAAFALLLVGCAPFGEPFDIATAVVPRTDGPAAAIVPGEAATLLAFAHDTGDGTAVSVTVLGLRGKRPRAVTQPSPRRRGAPLALPSRAAVTLVWPEFSGAGATQEIWWSEAPRGGSFTEPQGLPGRYASPPRGAPGGQPAVAMAERPPPGSPPGTASRLAVWQRSAASEPQWHRMTSAPTALPSAFTTLGTEPGTALMAWVAPDRRFHLGPIGAAASGSSDGITLKTRPAGPEPPWLAAHGAEILAAWSSWTPGGPAGVHLRRSSDSGATWAPLPPLYRAREVRHPLASFAHDGARVAAVWRASGSSSDRIVLAISDDFGASFRSPAAVDAEPSPARRTRPRVAIQGDDVLVTWQVGETEPKGKEIRASYSSDGGATFPIRDGLVATARSDAQVRNPQPWLDHRGAGGVVWESLDARRPKGPPTTGQAPRVSLHARPLRG